MGPGGSFVDQVAASPLLFRRLDELEIAVPNKLGVAIPSVVKSFSKFSGIDDDSHEVGRVAAAFLTSLVERGERDIPRRPQRVLVRGVWHEGQTLRPLPAAGS